MRRRLSLTCKQLDTQDALYLKNKLTVFNHSGPPPALKLTKVIGKSKRELANIGGITPAVLIFNGKCEDSATLFPAPGCLFGILYCNSSLRSFYENHKCYD